MALLQAGLIGLIALIVTPGLLFYFDVTPKVVVLLAGTGVALLAATVLRPVHRVFSGLVLLSVISLAISTAGSAHPALSAFGANWRRFGAVAQAAVLLFAWLAAQHCAGRPERVRLVLRGVTLAGGVSALYGIAQYFGVDPLLPAAAYHIGQGVWTIVRPPGTLGYVSYFATWLLLAAFLSLALHALETGPVWRWIAVASAGLSTIAMLLTGTRAAALGLAAGIAVWLYYSGFRVSRRAIGAAVLLLAAAAAFYYSPVGQGMRSRTRWFIEDPWGGGRPLLWRDSLRMALARPLAGFGPEDFTGAFPAYESAALARLYPDFSYESPHNILLDALVAQGIPGLLILAALCVAGMWRPTGSAAVWMAAAVAAGFVAQQFTTFILPTAVIFFTSIALAVALRGKPGEDRRSLPFTLAAAPVALGLVYVAVRLAAADFALEGARRAATASDLPAAIARYARYRSWSLPGASSDLWYSRTLLDLALKTVNPVLRYQAVAESGAAAVRATTQAEDPFDAWYNMAQLYAGQNDAARTESSLRAAIAARPNWFKPHWALAQLLRMTDRLADAEHEAATAADLDSGKNPEVARTLAEIQARRALLLLPPRSEQR